MLVVGLLLCSLVALVRAGSIKLSAVAKKRPLRLDYLLLAVVCAIGPCLSFYSVGLDGIKAPMIHDITTDRANPPVFLFTRQDEGFRENSLVYRGRRSQSGSSWGPSSLTPIPISAPCTVRITGAHGISKGIVCRQCCWAGISPRRMQRCSILKRWRSHRYLGLSMISWCVLRRLDEQSSAIDIRSVSRVGVSDIGANAKRIRLFFDKLGGRIN